LAREIHSVPAPQALNEVPLGNGFKKSSYVREKSVRLGTSQIHIETGKLANKPDGSVTVQLGERLSSSRRRRNQAKPGQDFFRCRSTIERRPPPRDDSPVATSSAKAVYRKRDFLKSR